MLSTKIKGQLVLIVGPSGSGKGSVISELKKRHPDWVYPISFTTRKRRTNDSKEVYHFISKEEFEKGIRDGDFLEHAIVHSNNYYGTGKKQIIDALSEGKIVVKELDIQGFKLIREVISAENLMAIFLNVNSLDDLIERIQKRGKLPEEEIQRRMESAQREISQKDECDYVVPSVTGEIQACSNRVEEIILKEVGGECGIDTQ